MGASDYRYRLGTKLAIANTALLLVVAGALATSTYWQLHTSQRRAMRDRLHDILNLSAAQIDGDIHTLVQSASDVDGPYYRIIETRLTALAHSNPDILRIYTLRTSVDAVLSTVANGKIRGRAESEIPFGQMHVVTLASLRQTNVPPTAPVLEDDFRDDRDLGATILRGYAPFSGKSVGYAGLLVIELDVASALGNELFEFLDADVEWLELTPE